MDSLKNIDTSDNSALRNRLLAIMQEIKDAPVECDGFVNLAGYLLYQNEIEYDVYQGKLFEVKPAEVVGSGKQPVKSNSIGWHTWIVVGDYTIDYRAKMWLGEGAPHGVFKQEDVDYCYQGSIVNKPVISKVLFDILKMAVVYPLPK